jgi:hypothetical protein
MKINELIKNKYFIIFIVIIALIITSYLIGKKQSGINVNTFKLTDEGGNTTNYNPTEITNGIAKEVSEIKWYNLTSGGIDTKYFLIWLGLNDLQSKAVALDYNERYLNLNNKGTFGQMINSIQSQAILGIYKIDDLYKILPNLKDKVQRLQIQ